MASLDVDETIAQLFHEHARPLVRLARLFADDRNAAEDLVQEAFLRLRRALDRIKQRDRAAAYLRSIVLNLIRDHNRRGLMSLRHQTPADAHLATVEDTLVMREGQQQVIEALRDLPPRQRDCLVLRYYLELGTGDIADTLALSTNSVKTHMRRGMAALAKRLGEAS